MHWDWYGGWYWWHGWGAIVMMVVWIVVIGFIVWAVQSAVTRNTNTQTGRLRSDESPKEILKKRYARGEITKEEYEQMKRELNE